MTDSDGRTTTRRRVLRRIGLGSGVGTALLAGCGQRPGPTETETPPGTDTGTPEGPSDERADYGTVIDMVEAGADPQGGAPIDELLREHAGDDTLLYFREGEYFMERPWQFREFEHFGILGDGAVIRPPEGFSDFLFAFGQSDRAVDLLFKGIEFDVTAPETGIRPVHATVQKGLHVADVTVRGVQDTDQDSFRFDVTHSEGTGLVENLRLPDGGVADYAITGCYVGDVSEGTLTFRDCHIANFPDNGIYASNANGPVHVIGGVYENNNVANVRVTTDAVVRGVTSRSTESKEGFYNVRGIRLRSGRNVLVEDCSLEFTAVNGSDGAITMHTGLESGTVRNTRIKIDTDGVPAIMAKSPEREPNPGSQGLRLENVEITGAAANQAAVEIHERVGIQCSGICIHQPGEERNGIQLVQSSDVVLRDSSIHVAGDPLVVQDSTFSRDNVRTGRALTETSSTHCQDAS